MEADFIIAHFLLDSLYVRPFTLIIYSGSLWLILTLKLEAGSKLLIVMTWINYTCQPVLSSTQTISFSMELLTFGTNMDFRNCDNINVLNSVTLDRPTNSLSMIVVLCCDTVAVCEKISSNGVVCFDTVAVCD